VANLTSSINTRHITSNSLLHHRSPTGSIILPSSAFTSPQISSNQIVITSNLIHHERVNSKV